MNYTKVPGAAAGGVVGVLPFTGAPLPLVLLAVGLALTVGALVVLFAARRRRRADRHAAGS